MNLETLNLDALWIFLDSCTANPGLRSKIETEFTRRIPAVSKFTREYLYSVNIIGKKALIIYFIPGTVSFAQFGRKVVVNLVLDEETREELANNYAAKPAIRTHGKIKSESLITEGVTEVARKDLRLKGFDTTDIMLCEWE